MQDYSVLMSVYIDENPIYLQESLESMLSQTIQPAEIILVCDGILTKELRVLIDSFVNLYPKILKIFSLEKNQGLGKALKYGVEKCSNEIIFRMDTDDISIDTRCALQLKAFAEDYNLVLVGGNIEEFYHTINKTVAARKTPETDNEIRRKIKLRNTFNHMTIAFRKSAVLAVGNYEDILYFEDYWLWMRMLSQGNLRNLKEVLVYARTGENMYVRRGGIKYLKSIYIFQKKLLEEGYINISVFLFNMILRGIVALIPNKLREFVYLNILRKQVEQ